MVGCGEVNGCNVVFWSSWMSTVEPRPMFRDLGQGCSRGVLVLVMTMAEVVGVGVPGHGLDDLSSAFAIMPRITPRHASTLR